MMQYLKYLVWALLPALCICCNDPEPIYVDKGMAYFPLESGKFLEYRVDSIIFDDAGFVNKLDTFSSFIRERYLETFTDVDGDTLYRIEREYRKSVDEPWEVIRLWTASENTFEGIRGEENQRIVKMEFPLYEGKAWSPTKYINTLIEVPVGTEDINMFSYWEGEVISIDQFENIGPFAFDSVMTCLQANDDNDLERRYVLEKYAKGIGLVQRTDSIIDSRCERLGDFAPCEGMQWIQKGEKGYIMHQELIDHN